MACPYAGKTGTVTGMTNGTPNYLLCTKWHLRHGFIFWQSVIIKKFLKSSSLTECVKLIKPFVIGFVVLLPFIYIDEHSELTFGNLRFNRGLL